MSDGHQVSALARNAAKAERLRQQGAVPVEVSLFDAEALAEVFSGHGAVINLATAIPPMRKFMSARAWAASQRVRTEGSTAVVDAALAASWPVWCRNQWSCSTPTAVTPGSTRTPPSTGTRWPRATTPTRPTPAGSPTAEGTGVILRFGWFYGPGAAHSEQMLTQARHHIIMTLGDLRLARRTPARRRPRAGQVTRDECARPLANRLIGIGRLAGRVTEARPSIDVLCG